MSVSITMAAVAAPRLPEILEAYELRDATRQTYMEAQRARMAAVMGNTRSRVTLGQSGQMLLELYDLEQGTWQELPLEEGWAGRTAALSMATSEILFAPNGSAPAPGTIAVSNGRGLGKEVVVSPAGSIRIE